MLITTKYACKIPLAFEDDLDPFVKRDLKPVLYQSPTLYNKCHQLCGLVEIENRIFLLDSFGAIYETSLDEEFEAYNPNLQKKDELYFKKNDQFQFTYDVLDVSKIYNQLINN